jgi:hypothetical protein
MAGEKRVSASEKRSRDIANFSEINDLATVSPCLPVAEFRAAGSGLAADRHRNLAKDSNLAFARILHCLSQLKDAI